MRPYTPPVVYLDFEPDSGEEWVRAGYGVEKYEKLVTLKDMWDPKNLFPSQSEHQAEPRDARGSPSLSQSGSALRRLRKDEHGCVATLAYEEVLTPLWHHSARNTQTQWATHSKQNRLR